MPLAESFDIPLVVLWSSKGLNSTDPFINSLVPEKVLSKETSHFVIDDWDDSEIQSALSFV